MPYADTPQGRAKNAARQKAYRAKRKLEAAVGVMEETVVLPGGGTDVSAAVAGDPDLKITVKPGDPRSKPTLRERLGLGGGPKQAQPQPARRGGARKIADKPNLIVTLLPTILASLVATYARDRLPEEYQACAPTRQEVKAILDPLMDIIGRRVEVAAEVSQDVLDLTNALICTIAYGARAYVTYVDIKKGLPDAKQQHREEPAPVYQTGLRAYQNTDNRISVPVVGGNGTGPAEPEYGLNSNGADHPDDAQQLRDNEAAQVASLFRRDREGRVQLGLLPRGL